MRILNKWFSEEQRYKVALYIFSSVVGGFLLTWGALGQISVYAGWKSIFWIPGVVMFLYSFIWYIYVRNSPEEAGVYLEKAEPGNSKEDEDAKSKSGTYTYKRSDSFKTESENNRENTKVETEHTSFIKFILHTKLYLVALSGIPLGFVREGISLWGPTMLFETFGLDLQSTMGSVLLIPFFNIFGGWNFRSCIRISIESIWLGYYGISMDNGRRSRYLMYLPGRAK